MTTWVCVYLPCHSYLALVLGHLTGCGVIDHPVSDRSAVTLFRVEGHRPSGEACRDTGTLLLLLLLWEAIAATHPNTVKRESLQ